MARGSGTGARQTKAERKEAARRQREELQRKMARQRRNRRVLTVLGTALVAAVVVVVVVVRPGAVDVPSPDELLAQAVPTGAGCGEVENVGPFQPENLDGGHKGQPGLLTLPPLSEYPSVPPASGPHNPLTQPAGVYDDPPSIDQVLHSLEHGAAVVWYDPSASGEELERVQAFYREGEAAVRSRVIVAPYDYPDQGGAGLLPSGTQMALVAWHYVQACERVSLPAAFGFTARYSAPPFEGQDYAGEAPEAGNRI